MPVDLGEKLRQMMDVSRVNATLRAVEEERDVLNNRLTIERDQRKEMEGICTYNFLHYWVVIECLITILSSVWSFV